MALFQVIDGEGRQRHTHIHRLHVAAVELLACNFPWEDRYAKFKELLDAGSLNLKIFAHPDRKALLPPLMKRAELVMADYEEWVVSGGKSIVMGEPQAAHGDVPMEPGHGDDGIAAAMRDSGGVLHEQLGDDPKWQKINVAIWSAIQRSDRRALRLAELSAVASQGGWGQQELLAVIGLLGSPRKSLLRMNLYAADGSDVPGEEIARKLASWWKDKTMTDAEWKAWSSQIEVSWSPVSPRGTKQ